MTAVYLIRHGKAKNRLKWSGADHLRPLTKVGFRQAAALVALHEGQPFSRLCSSSYLRCVQTLEPLAEARQMPLETADALAEGAPTGDAIELMLSVADDGPAALCTHGDVMQNSIEALVTGGIRVEGPLEFAKSATWILEIQGRTFTSARYLSAPRDGLG